MITSTKARSKTFSGAVFLDLDGTLWPDLGPGTLLKRPNITAELVFRLSDIANSGHAIIGFTNQTYFGYKDRLNFFEIITYRYLLKKLVRKQILNAIFICHHHPKSRIQFLRKNCSYRKPSSDLLLWARNVFNISLEKCVTIGDRITDILASHNVGIRRNFLIINPECLKWNDTEVNPKPPIINFEVVENLIEALDEIQQGITYDY
jgi:D-glycero-D-manno-heptose 1,7-bisphosphate phosphatase